MGADIDIKTKWASAHQRALRAAQSRSKSPLMPESPLAHVLDVHVNTSITEGDLKAKILAREETHPGFMRASYKGCCLSDTGKGFPKFYKRVLGSMLNSAQKKSLQKAAKHQLMVKEVKNNEVIQAAINLFNPTRVETKKIRADQVRPKRIVCYGSVVDHQERN